MHPYPAIAFKQPMNLLPRSLVLLLVVYLAVAGYALVAWLPGIVDGYRRLHETSPNVAIAYLAAVSMGALLLVGLSVVLFFRLWRNTRHKTRRRESRSRDPSKMTASQKESELRDNLDTGRDYATDAQVSAELRKEIEASLSELERKQEGCRLEIVAFGTISSGKSTLLNALAGRQVFASNVVGGTTTTRSEIPWPGNDRVLLVDTPGLAEVRGESRASAAAATAQNADLVLLVVDGPLKSYEVDLVNSLLEMEKRIVVCLNKEDWYAPAEESELTGQIRRQLPGVAAEDVVPIRASTVTRTRVRVTADGEELQEETEMPPDVEPLAVRLMQIVDRDGSDLLLANLLLQSRGLVDNAKDRVRAVLDKRAQEIIYSHMWAAGGIAGVNPIPLLDIAGGSAVTVKMILELGRVYKQSIDTDTVVKMLEQMSKNLVIMVGTTAATPAVASGIGAMLKTVPGIGTIAGGLVQGVVQALVTRWVGNVFVKYFRNEMKAPPGGLAELARDEWQRLTQPESLRKLIQWGRRELDESSDSPQVEDRR